MISWKNWILLQNLHKQDTHCDSNYTVVYQEIFFFTFSEHETTEWANCGYRTLILFLHCGRHCQILFQIVIFLLVSGVQYIIWLGSFLVQNGKYQLGIIVVSDATENNFMNLATVFQRLILEFGPLGLSMYKSFLSVKFGT